MNCLFQIAERETHVFAFEPIGSKMYIILFDNAAMIVDPCINYDARRLLLQKGITESKVFLTHEHYDHISGVNWLREICDCCVYCTKMCAENIADPRKNSAAHYEALFLGYSDAGRELVKRSCDPQYKCSADVVYDAATAIDWQGLHIELVPLPGHSKGSQIIVVNDKYFFTGDSLIPGVETITRLPGGSRKDFEQIACPYLNQIPAEGVVLPGHGEPAYYMEVKACLGGN